MRTSEQIDKIVEALAKAQGQMKNPENNKTVKVRTKDGRTYEYSYATLNSVFDVARKALSENGLAHTAGIRHDNGHPILVCRLMHVSGQFFESDYALPTRTNDDKAFAASMTYGRRYLFNALTGIAGDEDTDSEPEENADYKDRERKGSQQKPPQEQQFSPQQKDWPKPPFMGQNEWNVLGSLRAASKLTQLDLTNFISNKFNKVPKDLDKKEFDEVCAYLNQNRKTQPNGN